MVTVTAPAAPNRATSAIAGSGLDDGSGSEPAGTAVGTSAPVPSPSPPSVGSAVGEPGAVVGGCAEAGSTIEMSRVPGGRPGIESSLS